MKDKTKGTLLGIWDFIKILITLIIKKRSRNDTTNDKGFSKQQPSEYQDINKQMDWQKKDQYRQNI